MAGITGSLRRFCKHEWHTIVYEQQRAWSTPGSMLHVRLPFPKLDSVLHNVPWFNSTSEWYGTFMTFSTTVTVKNFWLNPLCSYIKAVDTWSVWAMQEKIFLGIYAMHMNAVMAHEGRNHDLKHVFKNMLMKTFQTSDVEPEARIFPMYLGSLT